MMARFRIVHLIIVPLAFTIGMMSCGNANAGSSVHSEPDTVLFALPEIPRTLTIPIERAAFLAEHYWDRFNPDLLRTAEDSMTVEQAFVDFLTIIPEAEKDAADKGVCNLLEKSSAKEEAYTFILELATKYLYEADSPMENEEMFLPYLQYAADSARADDYIRMRANFLLERVQKNRPGTKASDFQYITRDNKKRNLWSVNAKELLLIFYDPECQHCMEIINQIMCDSDISDRLNNGKLKILAIYTEGNESVWIANKNLLPTNWIVGKDISGITENEIYDLKAMPTLYLLDKDKRVLTKDLDIRQITR